MYILATFSTSFYCFGVFLSLIVSIKALLKTIDLIMLFYYISFNNSNDDNNNNSDDNFHHIIIIHNYILT